MFIHTCMFIHTYKLLFTCSLYGTGKVFTKMVLTRNKNHVCWLCLPRAFPCSISFIQWNFIEILVSERANSPRVNKNPDSNPFRLLTIFSSQLEFINFREFIFSSLFSDISFLAPSPTHIHTHIFSSRSHLKSTQPCNLFGILNFRIFLNPHYVSLQFLWSFRLTNSHTHIY